MFKLVLAGGGTGGHLFPGLAVAAEFTKRDKDTQVLVIGTGRPIEKTIKWPDNFILKKITAKGLKGASVFGRLQSLIRIPVGIIQSMYFLFQFKPNLVFCLGGYSAGPVGLASKLLGIPSAIHESNSVPGLTNKLLGRFVNLVFVGFESAGSFFSSLKVRAVGNPVRVEIIKAGEAQVSKEKTGFSLLVLGGSQGSHAINTGLAEAAVIIKDSGRDIEIMHQSGKADLESIRQAYEEAGINAHVDAFIQDMVSAYENADLVLARAGALTVAELATMGKPAVFVPLPTAADNHQEANALSLVDIGGAEMILEKNLTPQFLAETLESLMDDPDKLDKMGKAARAAAKPLAAGEIVNTCIAWLKARGKPGID